MLTREKSSRQRIELRFVSDCAGHVIIKAMQGDRQLPDTEIAILSGTYRTFILLEPPEKEVQALFQVCTLDGKMLQEKELTWTPPRKWELYVMLSSHTDIGLHNSQYIQRHNSADFIDKAIALIDQTEERPDENRYHYCMEGTWFWNNYALERDKASAEKVVRDYIKPGKLGIAAGLAGNCTQLYGMEELCRSAYLRHSLKKDWDIDCETMTMIDFNGISWSIVEPYSKAGYRNLFWAPNPWNPLQSTVYTKDMSIASGTFTPQSCASGSRCDVRYGSALPMVFYWQGADNASKLLVWASTQYGHGASEFGLAPSFTGEKNTLAYTEMKMASQLPKLEKAYPYDIWLMACYGDDQEPSLDICDRIAEWNSKWAWPRLRTVGNLDEPFTKLRTKYEDAIPTLRGEITGGWYQLALCTPELLARKFAADTALPTAEKIATIAAMECDFQYPQQSFQCAWYALLCNDEHSYGASGYQGRRVYETWMQHRAWIELAEKTAATVTQDAMEAIAANVQCDEPSLLVFNPTMQKRKECITWDESCKLTTLPLFGWTLLPLSQFHQDKAKITKTQEPPCVENECFMLKFNANGSIKSIIDKTRGKELLDNSDYGANQLLYTDDNHASFHSPINASFTIEKREIAIKVTVNFTVSELDAEIRQTISLPSYANRIDLETEILHAKAMVNQDRYKRYIYIAFPFAVENARKIVQLNGCTAQHGIDHTGHGTDTYSAAREWVAVENDKHGIALAQLDTSLVEFDHIHTDKTDYGAKETGSSIFSYVANDWLQMHTPGGSHIDMRFRYSIIPYDGTYQQANIPDIAEQIANPPLSIKVEPHPGRLPAEKSFLGEYIANARLLALKVSETGKNIVFRIRESKGCCAELPETAKHLQMCSLDERIIEQDKTNSLAPFETRTFLLPANSIAFRDETPHYRQDGIPEKVGCVYTGLIDEPRAACGEEDGMLYLLWGQNPEKDIAFYELYRGEKEDFVPSEDNFVAKVERGEYCVARYVDTGLEHHKAYFYRVRAINEAGKAGEFSDVFCGVTRED